MAYDLLIKNGMVVDGSGDPRRHADVAVERGIIVEVGRPGGTATRVIDAGGMIVAPGFWDMHTHYDAQLLWDPLATSSAWHGVTTAVIGNCGFTLAPCRPGDEDWLIRLMSRVEDIPTEAIRTTLPWSWGSFASYLDALDRVVAINVIAQVGHSAVRRYVMGEDASQRTATPQEIEQMRLLVAEAIRAGAMGFSTSRSHGHFGPDGRPVPSRLATREEYLTLAKEMSALRAGFAEYAPLDQKGFHDEAAVRELRELAEATGLSIETFVFGPVPGNLHGWREQHQRMLELRGDGVPVFALVNPHYPDLDFTLRQEFNGLSGWETWRQVLAAPMPERLALLRDTAFRARIREEMKINPYIARGIATPELRWDRVLLVESATGKHRALEGRDVASISEMLGKEPLDACLDISLEEGLETRWRQQDSLAVDAAVMMECIASDHVLAGFTDGGAHADVLAMTGFPTKILGRYVREQGLMTVETAVRKMTGAVADEVRVTDRGYVKAGQGADITIFDPETVRAHDPVLTHDLPRGAARLVQRSEGIAFVVVNGAVVLEHGRYTGTQVGRVLRGTGYGIR